MQRAGEGAARQCAAAFVIVLGVAGCGEVVKVGGDGAIGEDDAAVTEDGSVPGDPCDGPTIEPDEFAECFTEARCEYMVRCEGLFTDLDQCLELAPSLPDFGLSLAFTFNWILDSVEEGTVDMDGALMYECLESMATGSCTGDDAGGGEVCERALRGTVAPGDACYHELECLGGGDCESESCGIGLCCLGACTETAGADESCLEEPCGTGLRCVAGVCVSGEVDSPCSGTYDCDAGLFCGASETCQPRVGADESCEVDQMCAGDLHCVDGSCAEVSQVGDRCATGCVGPLYCDPGSLTCRSLPGESESCADSDCLGYDLLCDASQTCRRAPAEGEACIGLRCGIGLYCLEIDANTTSCERRKPLDAGCQRHGECESLFCGPGSTCQEVPACYGD